MAGINIVPMSTGLQADGSPDAALMQALAARRKAAATPGQQLSAAAAAPEPIYNKGLGYAKLLAGAVGGWMEGQEARAKVDQAKAGANSAASLAQSYGLSPEQATQLKGLMIANPEAASAIVKQMSERMFAKPDARFVDERLPDGSLAQRNATTNELTVRKATDVLSPQAVEQKKDIATAGKPQVSVGVNTAANPILEGYGKQFVEQRAAASAGADTIRTIHNARKEMEKGIFTGAGADRQLDMARVGAAFGITDPAKIANTETFRSVMAATVLNNIKTLGANPSNADRDFIEKLTGGQISLNEQSIKRLLDMQEQAARDGIKRYNSRSDEVMKAIEADPKADQNGLAIMRALGPVQEPPAYVSEVPPPAAAPAPDPTFGRQPAPQSAPAPAIPQGLTLDAIDAEIARRQAQQPQPQRFTDPMGGTY